MVTVAAPEGAPDRIRVNAIAPARADTPVWDSVPAIAARITEAGRAIAPAELAATTPLGRFASADEVAAQIAFLLSDAAMITGACLLSDGGYTL